MQKQQNNQSLKQPNEQQKDKSIQIANQQLQKIADQKQVIHPSCAFYLTRKKRLCKFPVVKGSVYCAAHCSDDPNKIQCPYQKGMFIDAAKFQKHMQICPKIKNKKQYEQSQWFTKGVNLNQEQLLNKAQNFNSVIDIQENVMIEVVHKVIKYFVKCFGEKCLYYILSTEEQKLQNYTNDHMQAHLLAQAAFQAGLIRDDIIYLQFGAGKGILSYYISQKVKKQCKKMSKNVLLQRETRKNKFDRFMKDNPYFQRFKSDVADFDVKKLAQTMAQTALLRKPDIDVKKQAAQINELQIVGVCKHMCGGALDISLRALMKTKMNGCILASCCHHLCTYQSYLNNSFFQQNNFSPNQIQVIFKISAWGTKSTKVQQKQINFEQLQKLEYSNLHNNVKVIIGRMCKRLIDLGRAQFLKCKLIRYCSDQITPQNFVIISQ